ncbi:chalcone isomerase family protein [Jeongeupia chitinilytica]|uniref:Chalcone isomerase domain-containing protein n=1 Tax=Jeongeupia chitinilytica TaxID=1041641 RepID=A0ABQ3H2A5_9NEIS|nr:chalcone isomerase family protein [Jeongeupia chitinilytica]GHD64275.1 hypothetical protein GCM10007350_23060 [Jeongeupia chitinilytica]
MRALLAGLQLALLLASGPAGAGWRDDVADARLQGEGMLRYIGFPVYQARLWSAVPPSGDAVPFALELHYRRSISRERLADTSIDEIRRIFGERYDDAHLQQWRGAMLRAFVDVRDGDRITGVFLPGRGARFYAGERLTADIADPVFAHAFFAIWLDPATRDPALRASLLGLPR